MFTGIVEETGNVLSFAQGNESWQLEIGAYQTLEDAELGDSIAVNGCCLTLVEFGKGRMRFDLLAETCRLTTFDQLSAGGLVNLERAARLNGKMGGHFVTGHIDGVGRVEVIEARGNDTYLRVRVPTGSGRYLVHKGSVAIEGISLTVAEVDGDSFAVWLIPHTMKLTNLHTKQVGDRLNLEFDMLGKYVEKLVAPTLG